MATDPVARKHRGEALVDSYCVLVAKRPYTVCCSTILGALLACALPFLIFQEETIVIDLSLDSYKVRGNDIGNREEALEAAFCNGVCSDDDERRLLDRPRGHRRLDYYGPAYVTVIYSAFDNETVLTEERLGQALQLEREAAASLGEPTHSPLRQLFPFYPNAAGLPSGAALVASLADIAEHIHDTRNRPDPQIWPHYDRSFTACDPNSKLLSSRFYPPTDEDRYEVYAAKLPSLITNDLYISFFVENDDWFHEERNRQIKLDVFLCFGVIASTVVMMALFTQSAFIAVMGMFSIVLSAGVAVFLYRICLCGWFGLLNGFAFFLLLGIGCDDIFVLVDAWRQSSKVQGVPPDDYLERLRYALPRAGKSIMVTSLTTSVAFFGNAICDIPPFRLFGMFSGFMVLVDFALTVLLLPSVLVLQHRLFGAWDCGVRCKSLQAGIAGMSRGPANFAGKTCVPRLLKMAPVTLILSAIIAAISLNVAVEMPPGAEFHESELFPLNHNQGRAYAAKNLMKDLYPDLVWVTIVHGVAPIDTGDTNNPASKSDVSWTSDFDVYSPDMQQFMLDLCSALLDAQGLVRSVDVCWAQQLYNSLSELGLPFPASREDLDTVMARSWPYGLESREGGFWSRIYATGTVEVEASVTELRRHYVRWQAFMDTWNAEAARRGVAIGFQTSGLWRRMSTIENLASSVIMAVCISTALVAVMLVITLRNLVMVGAVLIHVIGVCLALVTFLVLDGRTLGVIESISITLLVGLSVDYLLHIANAFLEEPASKPRAQRTLSAISRLGGSVISGAATSLVAGAFLCAGKITFFSSMGTFVIMMISLSVFATFFPFLATLYLFGPESRFGEISCPRRFGGCDQVETETHVGLDMEIPPPAKKTRLVTLAIAFLILAIGSGVRLGLSLAEVETELECPVLSELDFTFEEYTIPGDDMDTYRCRGFDMFPSACTYYVTEVAPIVAEEVADVVHHMILFPVSVEQSTCPFTCFDMPEARGLDAGWAVGMGTVRWPSGMAYAMGGYKHALQMHYSNWDLRQGLVDRRSGLRLTISKERPKHVLTQINVGMHPLGDLQIPGGRPNATFAVDCAPDLRGPVTVQAYATHAHKLGISVVTEVRRRPAAPAIGPPTVVGDVGSDPYYNFNYQKVAIFPAGQERQLLPGDVVRVLCTFDSTSRFHTTYGGWRSEDEMCMTFLYVYPSSFVNSLACLVSKANPVT